ncbi:hypothetical protein OF897_09810 [Chryseobacterium formosus]|uniref:CopZ zinc binding domain-containing protein n=1 Tax=Chryseobacterium formosus TaxID=1537363 RepID=A0ABT3XTY8_9FLAO|nr:hypothetical protein [Chryseobacterium formosus]MCX8524214.1 hypothetical protein [Chryseobacterium formosus]
MKNIQLLCKSCRVELTDILNVVPESQLKWNWGYDILEEKEAVVYLDHKNSVLTNLDDEKLIDHSDFRRFSGCCGSSGSNGINKLCKNGHEVATETSDCCTSTYLHFSLEHTIIKEIF